MTTPYRARPGPTLCAAAALGAPADPRARGRGDCGAEELRSQAGAGLRCGGHGDEEGRWPNVRVPGPGRGR